MTEPSKTQSIPSNEAIRDLWKGHTKLSDRVNVLEVAQAKTGKDCESILDKITEMARSTKEYQDDAKDHRREMGEKVGRIESQIIVQKVNEAQTNTRWDILGKPITLATIGGAVALLFKWITEQIHK